MKSDRSVDGKIKGGSRVVYLDGIRGLAIAAVLAVHWIGSQFDAALGGYIGVDIFFVLSGYIITTLLWRYDLTTYGTTASCYIRFIQRRFIRLYPPLLTAVIGIMVIYAVFPGAPETVRDLTVPALMAVVQGSSFYVAQHHGLTGPFNITWSLSIEWIFYLIWPFFVYLLRRSNLPAGVSVKIIAATALVIYVPAGILLDDYWFYYGPMARIPELMIGGAVAIALTTSKVVDTLNERRRRYPALGLLALAFICGYVAFGPSEYGYVIRLFAIPGAVLATSLFIYLGARQPSSTTVRILSWKLLTHLGRISYSLYLWHTVAINVFTHENMTFPKLFVAMLGVAFCCITTALSYRFVELPTGRFQARVLHTAEH